MARRLAQRPFALISKEALGILFELQPVPYVVIDVIENETINVSTNSNTDSEGINTKEAGVSSAETGDEHRPRATSIGEEILRCAVRVPEKEIASAFHSSSDPNWWSTRFSTQKPDKRQVIVFLNSAGGRRATRAATEAASYGYSRCLVLRGGVNALMTASNSGNGSWRNRKITDVNELSQKEGSKAGGKGEWRNRIREINRDAVAMIMGLAGNYKERFHAILIDLRRHDERVLFGAIPNSVHLPVSLLPRALNMEMNEWQKNFRFVKPSEDCIKILQCANDT